MATNMLERSSNVSGLFWLLPTLCSSLAGDFLAAFRAETGSASSTALLAPEPPERYSGRILWLLPSGGLGPAAGGRLDHIKGGKVEVL
jgi:hypothetical protein